jgi:hypothetical protein
MLLQLSVAPAALGRLFDSLPSPLPFTSFRANGLGGVLSRLWRSKIFVVELLAARSKLQFAWQPVVHGVQLVVVPES